MHYQMYESVNKPSQDCEYSPEHLFLFFREHKQEGLQGQCETRMALFWQENGKVFPRNTPSQSDLKFNSFLLILPVLLLQDAADFEWAMWFSTFRNHILFALTGHVIFAKIFTLVAPKVRARVGMSHATRLHIDI